MSEVDVVVLHPEPGPGAGPLTVATAGARRDIAERQVRGFLAAGATRARIEAGPPDGRRFGERLAGLVDGLGDGGLVVLGSGAIPLATAADRRELVAVAASASPRALTNNRYSGDVVALARARRVFGTVDPATAGELAGDNALPRWLAEVAGILVDDRRGRTRLGVDVDGPLDLVLLGLGTARLGPAAVERVGMALARVRAVARDPSAELVVAGRVTAANLAWLEARTASRTRAIVEERGLRTRRPGQRPAASVLGALLDRDGPGALGTVLARLGDAAIVDTRVLLAHRCGAAEAGWPGPEDRFAADLLLHERIRDPWLRELVRSAADAPIPVVLGGHTLVGPGLRLALAGRRP